MVSPSCSLELKGINSPLPLIPGNNSSRPYSTSRLPTHRRRRPEAVLTANHPLPSKTASSQSLFLEPFRQAVRSGEGEKKKKKKRRSPINNETLDEWMEELTGEIVRNIGEAPFLMQIFSGDRKGVRLEKEAAIPDNWPYIKKRWDQESRTPDGIILIEEMKEDEVEEERISIPSSSGLGQGSKTWGLVVQGRGMECAACYILNTCRVKSSMGFCTHFCLVRAKCFRESLQAQVKNAWLQEGR
ncbi:uncharacterized protein [Typha latifolia]|uniref:uncharacterized protein n=1 Tax=Typha latifolia TaxID=4733 RepID=UPI003C2E60B9